MNPKTLNAQTRQVEIEVRRIREAWPTAQVRFTLDRMAAAVTIHAETFTYFIEVEPGDHEAVTRSLWVSHRHPIAEPYIPEWTDGWVD